MTRLVIHRAAILVALGWFVVSPMDARAQDDPPAGEADERTDTEEELRALEDQIEAYEARLAQTTREERSELASLRDLDRRVIVQEQLISTYRRRNRQLLDERVSTESLIQELQNELAHQRLQYRQYVRHAYKHGRMSYLSILLTSSSVNQMLIRVKYLKTFLKQRQKRLSDIDQTTIDLAERRSSLSETMSLNEVLLSKDRQEREKLARLRQERQREVERLRRQQSTLRRELEQSRRNALQLQNRLRDLITEDAETSTSLDPVATAELSAFSAQFSSSKGRLPWPAQGVITEEYGTRIHPVYRTRTPNPGIEIATSPGASVVAVHPGVVNRILTMPGYGTCVTISHGDYTTVYGNLSHVAVQQGARVIRGQNLGRSGTEAEPRQSSLFFAVFTSAGQPVDPKPWLRPR